MPLYLLTETSLTAIADGNYFSMVIGIPSSSDSLQGFTPKLISYYNDLNEKLADLTERQMKTNALSTEIVKSYLDNIAYTSLGVKKSWPGHCWFEFHPWFLLLDSLRWSASSGMLVDSLPRMDEIPLVEVYPSIKTNMDHDSSMIKYQHIALIGNTMSSVKFSDESISCLPDFDSNDPNHMQSLLEQILQLPPNTLFAIFLDVSTFCSSAILSSCKEFECNRPIAVKSFDFSLNEPSIREAISKKMKDIIESVSKLKKVLPNQSSVCFGPVPPQRIFCRSSISELFRLDHDTLHNNVSLVSPCGVVPSNVVFVGPKNKMEIIHNQVVCELRKALPSLLVPFHVLDQKLPEFKQQSLEIISRLEDMKTPFTKISLWEEKFNEVLISMISSTFEVNPGNSSLIDKI